jgi:hypothetical protein
VEKDTERVIVLVEIEESDDRPKTLLGDVFATMMADNIRFKEKKFAVGLWTTLIIKAKRAKFEIERVSRLQEKIDQLLSHLRTEQGWIGKVLLETYSDGDELIKNMTSEIDGLIEG